ncbi:MAG: DEAD/DEAH box helicase [Chitinophagaceae bacterium]
METSILNNQTALFSKHNKPAFEPRPYQVEAINAGVEFFLKKCDNHGLLILPTGSGKSLVIANLASKVEGKTIVLQPSKEILQQNFEKFVSYGYRAGIYSASVGMKYIDKITFATIGSIAKKHHLFRDVKNIIIDECHLVNAEDGMYFNFIKAIGAKVVGLTATPYRLSSSMEGAMLKFLTRTRPKIFNKVLYYVQNDVLFDAGHLAKLEYFDQNVIDRSLLQTNSTGSDFTEASVRSYLRKIDMPTITTNYGNRLLAKRKNLLVFCTMIEEANKVSKGVPGSVVITGETIQTVRDRILKQFKSGDIKCVINVGVLTTGFDYPELEAVLIARSTMSLALYYQIIGRVMRPHKDKISGWVVDLGGNIQLFGKIETMKILANDKGLYSIWNNGRQLTNVSFTKT